MFEIGYPAELVQDRDGKDQVVRFPDLKGTNTGADTVDTAMDEASDCLGSYLAALMAARQSV